MAHKRIQAGVLALAMTYFTGAQAAEEVLIPVNWPDGKVTTIVTHDRVWPNWLTAIFNHYDLDYSINGTDVGKARPFVDVATEACTKYTKTSQPSVVVDILGNVLVFGMFGAAYGPLVAQVNSAYAGVQGANSAAVGTSNALSGAASAITSEGKRNLSFYNCGSNLFDKDRPELEIHPIETVSY